MKTITKNLLAAGLSAACVLSLSAGVAMLGRKTASADDVQSNVASGYFYDHLTTQDAEKKEYTLAKKVYRVLEEMANSGDFKDGKVEYNLKDVFTSDEIKAWVENGDLTIPRAFSAARDSFLTDHPEIFYIDFYKLTVSAGRSNGVYTAYIDTGREATAYYDNGLKSEKEVENAIREFNAKVDAIANEALAEQAKDTYSAKDVFLARYVNSYLAKSISYDYVAYDNKDDPNYTASAYINSAYGGLVLGKAVCGGFSTAYKVVMDKLEIPCITVNGYSNQKDQSGNENGASVYHMWNYVYLATPDSGTATAAAYSDRAADDGKWYSVDVTWNSASSNKNRYTVLKKSDEEKVHVKDGVISSSGYELTYPELSALNYGSTGETEGLVSSIDYLPVGDEKDDYGNSLQKSAISVSYNGKSAKTLLEEDGLYLAYRVAAYMDVDSNSLYSETKSDVTKGNWQLVWNDWVVLDPYREFADKAVMPGLYEDDGKETRIMENSSIYYAQFAVFDIAPDKPHRTHQGDGDTAIIKDYYFQYEQSTLEKNKPVYLGEVRENQTYGTYTPPPYVSRTTPNCQMETVISDSMRDNKITDKVVMAEKNAFIMEITYDEPLHILDESKPIGISFVSDHPNAKDYALFYPISKDANGKPVYVELVERAVSSVDPTLSPNTLRFKFAPSLMYEHNREGYTFSFTNVGSSKMVSRKINGVQKIEVSNKLPNPVYYSFGRLYRACPACFNYDGRLWVESCAQPQLVANSDLSAMDFKDADGNSTFSENERSQMMLVAEKASDETVNTMLDEISETSGIEVDSSKCQTFDIQLQICGKYSSIPDGSYVKIGLGFPEGYGPNDKGTKFKIFHRKHIGGDQYIIEEIPCVVTQFGIVATVTSFSPYMVAAVDASEVSSDKTILATIEGRGGKLTLEDGKIRSLKEGESYEYTIKPDDGYQIYTVTLNGKDVTDKVSKGKLKLTYDELADNNELEIKYIANGAVSRVLNNKLVSPVKVVTDGETFTKVGGVIETPTYLKVIKEGSKLGMILGIVGGTILAVIVAAAVVIVIKKKD